MKIGEYPVPKVGSTIIGKYDELEYVIMSRDNVFYHIRREIDSRIRQVEIYAVLHNYHLIRL